LSKIPEYVEKKIWESIIFPALIKVKSDKFSEVLNYIKDMISDYKQFGILRSISLPERVKAMLNEIVEIRLFNFISIPLPREFVWSLESEDFVEKIFHDSWLNAFQVPIPVVQKEGVYYFTVAKKYVVKGTSTFWVKKALGADIANMKGFSGFGVKVAVCDTGIFHLKGLERVKARTVLKIGDLDLSVGHGTSVCSCVTSRHVVDEIASKKVGKIIPLEGIAPWCDCYSIKCMTYPGTGRTSWIIKAIEDAVFKYNCDIINLSLGGMLEAERPEDDPMFHVLKECYNLNKIVCVASGNFGKNKLCTPGSLPLCLRVGAYDPVSGKVAEFTSRGATPWGDIVPDVSMPGVWIYMQTTGQMDLIDNTISGGSPASGTSFACPLAAGMVTLMKEAHRKLLGKELLLDEILLMMSELGEFKDKSEDYGYGILNWNKYETWLSTQYGIEI